MQCLECIEHKQKGNTKDLEKITSNCLLYQNNQCVHITTQIEPTPKLNLIKPLILLIGKLLFTVFMLIFLSIIVTKCLINYQLQKELALQNSSQVSNTYTMLMEQASNLNSDVEVFDLLGVQYVTFPDMYTEAQLADLKEKLLSLGDEASLVTPSELYNIIGVENAPAPQIYKVNGFVSDLIDDPYYGYTAVISDTVKFEAKSISVVKPQPFNLSIGDEVIFLCVPKLINIATPITVHGWVQP